LKNSLFKVSKIRGVYYRWANNEMNGVGNGVDGSAGGFESPRYLGVIAQDVQSVYPEATGPVHDGQFLGVKYSDLIPVLIEAIRELDERSSDTDTHLLGELEMLKGSYRRIINHEDDHKEQKREEEEEERQQEQEREDGKEGYARVVGSDVEASAITMTNPETVFLQHQVNMLMNDHKTMLMHQTILMNDRAEMEKKVNMLMYRIERLEAERGVACKEAAGDPIGREDVREDNS
jgi:hypothetical protein